MFCSRRPTVAQLPTRNDFPFGQSMHQPHNRWEACKSLAGIAQLKYALPTPPCQPAVITLLLPLQYRPHLAAGAAARTRCWSPGAPRHRRANRRLIHLRPSARPAGNGRGGGRLPVRVVPETRRRRDMLVGHPTHSTPPLPSSVAQTTNIHVIPQTHCPPLWWPPRWLGSPPWRGSAPPSPGIRPPHPPLYCQS